MATKILTDPFHDIKLYHKAPLALLRGELIDPEIGMHHWDEEDAEEVPRPSSAVFHLAVNAFKGVSEKTTGGRSSL